LLSISARPQTEVWEGRLDYCGSGPGVSTLVPVLLNRLSILPARNSIAMISRIAIEAMMRPYSTRPLTLLPVAKRIQGALHANLRAQQDVAHSEGPPSRCRHAVARWLTICPLDRHWVLLRFLSKSSFHNRPTGRFWD